MEAPVSDEPLSLRNRLIEEVWGQADELLKHDGGSNNIPGWGPCKVAEYRLEDPEKIENLSKFVLEELTYEESPRMVINRKDSRAELSLVLGYDHAKEGPSELRISLKEGRPPIFELARIPQADRIKVKSWEATHQNLNDFLLFLTSPMVYTGR